MQNFLIKIGRIGKSIAIHPLLLAVFPVFFLYSQNVNQTSVQQAFSSLIFIIPGTFLLWLLLYLWMKNIFKSGFAASLFLILFFSYGRVYLWLAENDIPLPGHGILIPLLIMVWGYAAYFIKITRRNFSNTTQVLNVVAVVLILANIFNLLYYQIEKPATSTEEIFPKENIPANSSESEGASLKPDIYFIVLDEYASPATIKDDYNYDSSPFINRLKKLGFFVATDSRTHNKETVKSVASVLDMEYIPETEPDEVSYQKIANNAVVNFLHSKGYQYVYFGQWYEEGRYTIPADTYYNFYKTNQGSFTTEFSSTLWNTTMLYPFYNILIGQNHEGYYRNGLIQTLDQIKKVPELTGPKFVYAHILCPHAPYIFGPDGERIAPKDYYNFDDKQYYLGQYIFISREIDKVIGEIMKKSTADPIIIVQSDHGPRWTNEWENILNAYHLPAEGEALLYDNISPVNSFRLIFNYYFKACYEILEDK